MKNFYPYPVFSFTSYKRLTSSLGQLLATCSLKSLLEVLPKILAIHKSTSQILLLLMIFLMSFPEKLQAASPPSPIKVVGGKDSLEIELGKLQGKYMRQWSKKKVGLDRKNAQKEWNYIQKAFYKAHDSLRHIVEYKKFEQEQTFATESMTMQSFSTSSFDLVPDSIELRVLKEFYNSTNGSNWLDTTNWLNGTTSADFENWHGIMVMNGDVYTIQLYSNNLTGFLPSSLGKLKGLKYLHLSRNKIGGSIPDGIGSLPLLNNLLLDNNQITGSIPEDIGSAPELRSMNLSYNRLTGTIPNTLGNLPKLTSLRLLSNQLTNSIPESLGKLTTLTALDLGSNQLTGSIPDTLGNLSKLTSLTLSTNQLNGSIPESLGKLTLLRILYLHNNQLTGSIPEFLGNLSTLTDINLSDNQLTGSIPANLANLPQLGFLHLGSNLLTGSIPANLGRLTKLSSLNLANNQLSGIISDSLGNLSELGSFYLNLNQLTGSIPPAFSNLFKLIYFFGDYNQLSGSIPVGFNSLPKLLIFDLDYNKLTFSPDLKNVITRGNIYLRGNYLGFSSIEINFASPNQYATNGKFHYVPQGLQGVNNKETGADTLYYSNGQLLEMWVRDEAPHNVYQWQKDIGGVWTDIAGASNRIYAIAEPTQANAGTYRCKITNTWVTNLTLYSYNIVAVWEPSKLTANLPNLNCPPASPAATTAPASGPANPLLNYVRTYTAQIPGVSATNISASYWPVNEVLTSTEYLDGLGRPIQTVQKQQSPLNQDIIQPLAYDAIGRQNKEYLPYTRNGGSDGNFRTSALLEQYNYYKSFNFYNGNQPRTGYPYVEKEFEASPLNRVLRQAAPGESWRLDSGHELKFSERSNTQADAVRLWQVIESPTPSLSSPSTYVPGELFVSTATDEHGFRTLEFKDKEGRVVLKKAEKAAGQYLSTYYVYDDLGLLRYVLPPKAVEMMAGSNWQLTTAANALVFRYRYDAKQRLIEKQVPGALPVYMVYNQRDLPILTQDGNQQAQQQWSFTKYDELNRPLFTGVVTDSRTPEQMQQAVDAHAVLYEIRDASSLGYTYTRTFPTAVTSNDLHTVTNYDYYSVYHRQFVAEAGHTSRHDRVLGQVTRKMEKVLGSPTWLATSYFYDDEYRLIQSIHNNYVNGTDRITTRYDFTGKVLETLTTHSNAAGAVQVVQQTMTYDHAGRLLNTYQRLGTDPAQINTQAQVLVAQQQYNELGQVIDKKLHSTDNGSTFLQSVDYRYNIRGWLTHINNSALSNDNGTTNNDNDDLFGMELSYEDCGFQKSYFNGNIAGVKWQSGGDRIKRAYGYQYDGLNRIVQADYRAFNSTAQTWTAEQLDATSGNYDMWGLRYDSNGNITALNRNGLRAEVGTTKTYGLLDQLTYKYEPEKGNQLQGVDDTETTTLLHDFDDKSINNTISKYSSAAPEYVYDKNGNLIEDKNKGFTVTYNHLNLPLRINFGNGKTIDYQYTASGVRVRKTVAQPSHNTIFTDYVGAMVYQNNALQFAQMTEGRLLYQPTSSNKWRYEYHLKDHLGNLRVAVAEPTTNTMMATMEASRAMEEDTVFTNVETTRQQDKLRARTGNYAARLNASQGKLLGPGKRLPVQKGDSVSVEVFGHYAGENKSNLAYSLGAWLLSNAVMQVQEPAKEGGKGNGRPAFPFISAGIAATPQVVQRAKDVPQAYLKYIAYDTAGNYLSSHYQLLSQTAKDSWEPLQLNYQPEQDGYVDIYVANESGEEVFFDDMTISSSTPMTIQENHYDPWGQNLVGIEKLGNPDHKYQYNGKEKQEEFGLHWNDHGARFYDPQLGRWHVVDPDSEEEDQESWSPYHFVLGNPISHNDPDGKIPNPVTGAIMGAAVDYGIQVAANLYVGKDLSDALTDVDYGSIAESAALGAVTSGISALTKGVTISKTLYVANQAKKATALERTLQKAATVTPRLQKLAERAEKLSQKNRDGMDATRASKKVVKEINKEVNNGQMKCESCNQKVVDSPQSKKGVSTPKNAAQVDHDKAKSKGGSGNPTNLKVLCVGCNLEKSNN